MNNFYLSQIFATCSLVVTVLCTWQKNRKGILLFLLLDSIFLTISYFFLEAYTGAITNIICIIRNIFFYFKEKNEKLDNKYIPISFITIHILLGVLSYNSWNSILPILGSVIFCITAWQNNSKTVRFGTAIMVLMWLIYDITIKSYVSIITETISFTSAVLAIIKIDILKGHEKYKIISKLISKMIKIRNKIINKI